MSREIRFRGLRKDNNEWVTGNLHSIYQENVLLFKRNWYTGEMVETVLPSPLHCSWILRPNIPAEPGWDMSDTYMKHEVVSNSVGQFTGLKDKNGTDIYEGDLVASDGMESVLVHDMSNARKIISGTISDRRKWEHRRSNYLVYWQENFACYNFKPLTQGHSINAMIGDRYLEIVGNIYQNPELL